MIDNLIGYVKDEMKEEFSKAFNEATKNYFAISSREDAARVLEANQFLKSERDALVSRTTDNYARKFQEERLPDLLKEELRKANPPKTPEQIENQELRERVKRIERDALLKDRKAMAMQKLTEAGLPADLADFAIHEDENIFGSNIERLSGLVAWKEAELKKVLTGAVGNQSQQRAGESKSNLESQYATAINSGNIALAMALKDKMAQGQE